MSRRSRPHYRPGLGSILGVAFGDTLTRPVRLAQGFTCVRCCGSPRASSPHGLTAPALASHDGSHCVQLPPARGCYQLAPQRTFTSNPVPMPGRPPSTPYRGPFGPSAAETTYYASALTGTDPLLLMETDPASAHEFVISWPDRPIPGRL